MSSKPLTLLLVGLWGSLRPGPYWNLFSLLLCKSFKLWIQCKSYKTWTMDISRYWQTMLVQIKEVFFLRPLIPPKISLFLKRICQPHFLWPPRTWKKISDYPIPPLKLLIQYIGLIKVESRNIIYEFCVIL
jgi:hypothetical protein